jgi:hypothetical protein
VLGSKGCTVDWFVRTLVCRRRSLLRDDGVLIIGVGDLSICA